MSNQNKMNIEGLDYNTQRKKLLMPEYGREIQKMVDYAVALPDKAQRQQCAEAIIDVMARMTPQGQDSADYEQKLWDHLAVISDFKLDIDWPTDVSEAKKIATRPQLMEYPMTRIPVRHYGKMMFSIFEQLKTMQPGPERDELVRQTANQMKRCLVQYSHGSADNEKVASDLARFTDGAIQLDLDTFVFERINERELMPTHSNNKKRRR